MGERIKFIENIIRNENTEYVVIIKDDIIMMIKKGEADKVSFSEYNFKIPENAILTHNHPKQTTFSIQDIVQIESYKLYQLRAITKKKTYILERKGVFSFEEWQKKLPAIQEKLRDKYPNINSFSFEEKIKVQEELYIESFKDTNVEFKIILNE